MNSTTVATSWDTSHQLRYFGESTTREEDLPDSKLQSVENRHYFGGYNVEILDSDKCKIETLKKAELLCMICTGLMRKPIQTECAHRACKNCFEHYIYINRENFLKNELITCPSCIKNEEVNEDSTFSFDRVMADYRVKKHESKGIYVTSCPGRDKNNKPCSWSGSTLFDLYLHEEEEHNNVEPSGGLMDYVYSETVGAPVSSIVKTRDSGSQHLNNQPGLAEAATSEESQREGQSTKAKGAKKKKRKKKKPSKIDSGCTPVKPEPVTVSRVFSLKELVTFAPRGKTSTVSSEKPDFDIWKSFKAQLSIEGTTCGQSRILTKLNVRFQLVKGPSDPDDWPLCCHLNASVSLGDMKKSTMLKFNKELAKEHPEALKIKNDTSEEYESIIINDLTFEVKELKLIQDRKTGKTEAKLEIECSFSKP